MPAFQKALPFQQQQRLAQRPDGGAMGLREIAFGRQLLTIDQPPRGNVPDQDLADLHVDRQRVGPVACGSAPVLHDFACPVRPELIPY